MEEVKKFIKKQQELPWKSDPQHVKIIDGEIASIEPLGIYKARMKQLKQLSTKP